VTDDSASASSDFETTQSILAHARPARPDASRRRFYPCLIFALAAAAIVAVGGFAWTWRQSAPIEERQVRKLHAYILLAASAERKSAAQVRAEVERRLGVVSLLNVTRGNLYEAIDWLDFRVRGASPLSRPEPQVSGVESGIEAATDFNVSRF